MSAETGASETEARQRWMGILAKAQPAELEVAWGQLEAHPAYQFLRKPEIGLVMTQGRMGGDGRPFNIGEMTVTRCSVRLDGGIVGHAMVAGRSTRHAELAAALDAMLQDAALARAVEKVVIAPLAAAHQKRRDEMARKAAATKVEFFTMVRGAV
ncbi:MAG TPA: phosphonate C-P lyase system protein PhnG [Magnetospirillaceae bacterium]